MKRLLPVLALCVPLTVILMSQSADSAAAPTARPVATAAIDTEIEPVEESMHEFMEYVFQPAYLRLKEHLASAPADNRAWKPVKSDALILAESCNLLFGRRPDEDGADWAKHAAAARQGGAAVYAAAKTRDYDGTVSAFRAMLNNCNACHRQFEEGRHILEP